MLTALQDTAGYLYKDLAAENNAVQPVLQKTEDSQITSTEFYVLLTVHLGIILVNNQLDAQHFFLYVYFNSLHVSNTHVLIIRRINLTIRHLVYVTLCRCLSGVQVWVEIHAVPSKPAHQTVTYTE
jgi:hypothetical protein